jgi:cyclohexanone monooxygenase
MIPHFTSGYIVRAREHMPRQGFDPPWQVHQEYLKDRKIMLRQGVDDGVLKLLKAGQPWRLPGNVPRHVRSSIHAGA